MSLQNNAITMRKFKLCLLFILTSVFQLSAAYSPSGPIRILVITGGHDYQKEQFNQMLAGLGENITCQIAELPAAYDMFLPQNRDSYDVLVFYHMWQDITDEQKKVFAECIANGKPLVVLHHSICAYDNWPEYINIIGGKYFHKPTVLNGTEYPACSYIHDVNFKVKIADKGHPVTAGLNDFEIFDETYKGFYVDPGVTPLLSTDEQSSTPVIGWTKKYGKARVVTLQSGHDVPTFGNPNFRKLLKQAIEWVYNSGESN
jgi:type 1 glutamine amidotransferase